MATTQETIDLYRQVAEEYQRENHLQERDRFLLLAADAALAAGQREEAEQLRQKLLSLNPNHLLKPYGSLAAALKSPDILAYVQQLRRSYPVDKAAGLLAKLRKNRPASVPREPEPVLPASAAQESAATAAIFAFADEPRRRTAPVRDVAPVREHPPKPAPAPAPFGTNPLPTWHGETIPETFNVRPAEPMGTPATFFPPPPSPTASKARTPAAVEDEPGSWVGMFLSFVVALGGLGLLAYVLSVPFVKL